MLNRVEITNIRSLITSYCQTGQLEFLGEGSESLNFTDHQRIYKYLKNKEENWHLPQLINPLTASPSFLDIYEIHYLKHGVIVQLEYVESEVYTQPTEDEMIQFLIDCYHAGIVCWDLKPDNFRISQDRIFFIDYGRDIKPFRIMDFVFMIQRAYLMSQYLSDFADITQYNRKYWTDINLSEFMPFFNSVWHKLVDEDGCLIDHRYDPFVTLHTETRLRQYFHDDHDNITHTNILSDMTTNPVDTISSILRTERKFQLDIILPNPFVHNLEHHQHIEQIIQQHNYQIEAVQFSPVVPVRKDTEVSRYIQYQLSRSHRNKYAISLMIKACYQDHAFIQTQIKHIVRQLRSPRQFDEIYVVVDTKTDDFIRQYDNPKQTKVIDTLSKLVDQNWIDRFYLYEPQPEKTGDLIQRWFGTDVENTHSIDGVPVAPQVYGFEQATTKYLLQADLDVLIGRRDHQHDYLKDMITAIQQDNHVLSVGFNICHSPTSSHNAYRAPPGGYVPEVRFCLFDVDRLLSHRPYPNDQQDGKLVMTWYRSIERYQQQHNYRSLRGGDPRTFYIHPPNSYKSSVQDLNLIQDRIEQDRIPPLQFGEFDLTGTISDWEQPHRNESFIFIINGRNVTATQFDRCFNSIISQTKSSWGAIITDDHSDTAITNYINLKIRPYRNRVTFIQNRSRRGTLYNTYRAITRFCHNPYAIILILDMDDFLINTHTLENVLLEYRKGNQMTVGSYIRRQKGIQPFIPSFSNLRNDQGGDIWQHLRTFRRYFFDHIDLHDFMINGDWVKKFTELTYLIPIAEMSIQQTFLGIPVYYWAPRTPRDTFHYALKQKTLHKIKQAEPYCQLDPIDHSGLLPAGEIVNSNPTGKIIVVRHAEKKQATKVDGYYPRDFDLEITDFGIRESTAFGRHLPPISVLMHSHVPRTRTTAKAINEGNDNTAQIVEYQVLGGFKLFDQHKWNLLKQIFGYVPTLQLWTNDLIDPGIVEPYSQFIRQITDQFDMIKTTYPEKTIVVVTHDHVITSLLYHQTGKLRFDIDHLSGIIIIQ